MRSFKFVAVIISVLILSGIVRLAAPAEAQSIPTHDPQAPAAVVTQVISRTRAFDPSLQNREMVVSSVKRDSNWLTGHVVVGAPQADHGGPRIYHFMAQQSSGQWQTLLDVEPGAIGWIESMPASLVNARFQSLLDNRRNPKAGNGDSQLSLPFGVGLTWWFNGTHGVEPTRDAMDFSPPSGGEKLVRASRDGIAVIDAACPNYVQVDHADGWSTGYYHLINEAVTNGQSVTTGTVVGTASTAIGCGGSATGDHVHWNILKDGLLIDLHGMHVGGWVFEDGSRSYEGCMVRIRDNFRSCDGNGLTNEGTIGTGSIDATNFWIFNRSLAGWTTNASMNFIGFDGDYNNGAAIWEVTGADPTLISPDFSGVSASAVRGLYIHMNSENDSCGKVFFRRSTDIDFDVSRSVDFTIEPDNSEHRYLVDMAQNANWNGTIVQIAIQVACNPANVWANLVDVNEIYLVPRITVTNTQLLLEPNFSTVQGIESSWIFRDMWWWLTGGGEFTIGRLFPPDKFKSTLAQYVGGGVPANTPFEAYIQLGNNDSVDHTVIVSVRDADTYFTGLSCTYVVPAFSPLKTYSIQGRTSEAIRNVMFEIRLETQTGTNSPGDIDVIVDNAYLAINPAITLDYSCSQTPTNLMADFSTPPIKPALSWTGVEPTTLGSDPTIQYRIFMWNEAHTTVIDQTWPQTNVCFQLTCSVNGTDYEGVPDWGLVNGDYEWWVGVQFPDGTWAWSDTASFTVNVPPADLPDPIAVNPGDGRMAVQWPDDPNTQWVQIWAGPHPSGSYFEWHGRDTGDKPFTCDGVTCTAYPAWDVPTATGQTVWMQAWGPGGFSEGGTAEPAAPAWNQMSATVDGAGTLTAATSFDLPADAPVVPSGIGVADATAADPTLIWTAQPGSTWYEVIMWDPVGGGVPLNDWYQASTVLCDGALVDPPDYDCELGGLGLTLSSGTSYEIYIRAWGPGGFSTGGDPYAEYGLGTFTYTPA